MDMIQQYTIDNERAICRIIGGEAVILETHKGYAYSLNETGTDIWKFLESHLHSQRIVRRLAEKYAVPEGSLKKDLERFLKNLDREKLIKKSRILRPKRDEHTAAKKGKKKYRAPELKKYLEIKRGRSVA